MLLLGTIAVVGLALVYWLPTRFPPPIAWSDSYIFEYNNRIAEVLFIALAATVWLTAKARGLHWPQAAMRNRPLNTEMPPRLLFTCLAVTALLCAFYGWLTYRGGGIGDGAYFLDRIHLMERGEVPYRDFEFVYGSFSLYASLFLGKIFACGSTAGFYILWVAETLLGVVLLWFAVRLLDLPAGGKRIVFLFFCLTAMLLGLSFAVTLLPHLDRSATLRSRLRVGGAALLSVILLLGISPEEGIAFAVAVLLYLPVRRWALSRPWLPDFVLLAVVLFAVYRFVASRGVFGTMGRFGAGAFNLPIFPGLLSLFFFAAFLWVVAFHGSGRLRERAPSNLALVMIYGFGMLPGALGRADGIHLLGYELPVIAVALLLCRVRPVLWRAAVLNHLYARGSPTSRLGVRVDRYITTKAARDFGAQAAAEKMAALRRAAEGHGLEPRDIFPGVSPVVMVPFQYTPNKLSDYQSPAIDEGYYMGLSNITVPSQIEEKVDEMRRHPERDLVVSLDGLRQCDVLSDSAYAMRRLLLAPFVPEPRHSVSTFTPVCSYIRENYHWLDEPSNATYGYGVMRHN